MGRRLRNLDSQLTALAVAIEDFSADRLAAPEWEQAFVSGNPDDINGIVNPVMGGYEHIVQNVIELAKAAGRTTAQLAGRRPRAEDIIEMLRRVGAISAPDKVRLDDLYLFRGRLSHDSPDITAEEMAAYAERILAEIPPMVSGIRKWLATEGISF
jgi:uncharacterized protein YutE (UPF0331/DUF86 family)